MVAALVMAIIFGMSSIAFILSGFSGQTQQEFQPLDSNVVEGEIDQFTKDVYIQNRFTFVELIYEDRSFLASYVDSLPARFPTPSGQQQIIVQKIKGSEDIVSISNFNGDFLVTTATPEKIEEKLCERLAVIPIECAFLVQNMTNTTN